MLKNELTGEEISNEQLNSISEMVSNQLRLQQEIADLQAQVDERADKLRNLSEIQIPDAMLAIGLSELRLANGEKVAISKFYSASIPADHAEEAFAWLRKTGNDDIIKNSLSLSFGRGEDDLAREVAQMLVQKGLAPQQKIFVHPMTLKSFVRERIEGAQELPLDIFGVYVGSKTKITIPKSTK